LFKVDDGKVGTSSPIPTRVKGKVKTLKKSEVHKILEKLEVSLQTDAMNMISIRDPTAYRKIIYIVEGELYKHKRKLYPKSVNNMGDGYS
jgi:hypothetical protein